MTVPYRNQRGHTVVNGRVMPESTNEARGMTRDEDDFSRTMDELRPDIDPLVREIEQETRELRELGKLKPFVEGEAIGALPRGGFSEFISGWYLPTQHPRERERAEMLALRAKNDDTIRRLLG